MLDYEWRVFFQIAEPAPQEGSLYGDAILVWDWRLGTGDAVGARKSCVPSSLPRRPR
jgi:hypothetical protein